MENERISENTQRGETSRADLTRPAQAPHVPQAQAPGMPELARGLVREASVRESIPESVSAVQIADECRARIAGHHQDPGEQ